ncbi:hypothetical protein E2F50_01015 [Rhizobium deserti]|uniref:Uncharacterized protein n=1 Tax=Rhizobium deserti TaxID=2547961 RepID=A0A4R5UM17_9HYPH|nr:hypothetical protein [Rhizobium deserti]TDK38764.1 hypothetical protein E2F50_01015 [Rhizobium deserti]
MKAKVVVGMALSLACISAAESPSNYQTYSGLRIAGDPVIEARYHSALRTCIPESATPPHGDLNNHSLRYNAALRACLYRYGFVDRGQYAYPANVIFGGFLAR